MELPQGSRVFRDQHDARGVPIQAMDQLKVSLLWEKCPQRFDQSLPDTAATMNRQTSGLINSKQISVIENDRLADASLPRR